MPNSIPAPTPMEVRVASEASLLTGSRFASVLGSSDAGSVSVTTTVKAVCTKAISGDHNLTIYLTEDSVIDDQLNLEVDPPTVENYVHRHVLRDNLNGTWGEAILTGSASAGDTLSLSYTYTLSANVLQPNNCALVAYIHPTTGTDARVVKQVAEAQLVP